MPTNRILDNDMYQLRTMLEKMINETKFQYADAFEALNSNNENAAMMIVEHDQIINDMLNEFTSTALWKIAKQKLVAKDLRTAVGGILLAREIEVIADYSKKVCVFFTNFKPSKSHSESIMKMFQLVIDMLDAFADFYINYNSDQIVRVNELENDIDLEFKNAYQHLIELLKTSKNKAESDEISAALLQVKNLERAGDHLLIVQEIVTFMRTGKFEEAKEMIENLTMLTNFAE